MLDRLVLHVLQEFVQALCHFHLRALRANHVTELADEVLQVVELRWVGHVVHTIREGLCLRATFLHLAHAFCHRAVGKKHEFLHEFVGILGTLEIHAERLALLVDFETRFFAVEIDGAFLHSLFTQLVRQAVEDDEFFLVGLGRFGTLSQRLLRRRILVVLRRCFVALLQQVLHFLVVESAVALDDGMNNAMVEHVGILVHLEHDGIAELFLVGSERTDEVAETLWQHRNGAVHEIDGSGTLLRFLVDDGAFEHIMRHVSNMHTHFPHTLFHLANRQCVVEVLGIARVNREGEHIAEVLALGNFLGCDARLYLVGSQLYGFWVSVRQTKLGKDGMHLGVVVSAFSQYVNHFANRVAGIFRP